MHIIPAPDLNIVRQLLQSAGLPTDDIDRNTRARFYLIEEAGSPVAVAGIECHGSAALLRSLLVLSAYRGQGLATRLVSHIRQVATAQGATALYLLTTSAADYFTGLGFQTITREAAPQSIRQTREFAHLCPAEATLLWCRL
jgi:N-acetylglutamate synthase-like GNAT family acetyltransferase